MNGTDAASFYGSRYKLQLQNIRNEAIRVDAGFLDFETGTIINGGT